MANADTPFGLKPVGHLSGGVIRMEEDFITSAYGTNIFTGDPVIRHTDGGINVAGASGAQIIGVFAGCRYVNSAGEQVFSRYWPASTTATNIVAYVYKDPNIVFAVQTDGSITVEDTGQNADTVAGAGDTKTGISAYEISATTNTTAALQLKILGKYEAPDNAWGTNVIVLVKINEHHLNTASGL